MSFVLAQSLFPERALESQAEDEDGLLCSVHSLLHFTNRQLAVLLEQSPHLSHLLYLYVALIDRCLHKLHLTRRARIKGQVTPFYLPLTLPSFLSLSSLFYISLTSGALHFSYYLAVHSKCGTPLWKAEETTAPTNITNATSLAASALVDLAECVDGFPPELHGVSSPVPLHPSYSLPAAIWIQLTQLCIGGLLSVEKYEPSRAQVHLSACTQVLHTLLQRVPRALQDGSGIAVADSSPPTGSSIMNLFGSFSPPSPSPLASGNSHHVEELDSEGLLCTVLYLYLYKFLRTSRVCKDMDLPQLVHHDRVAALSRSASPRYRKQFAIAERLANNATLLPLWRIVKVVLDLHFLCFYSSFLSLLTVEYPSPLLLFLD